MPLKIYQVTGEGTVEVPRRHAVVLTDSIEHAIAAARAAWPADVNVTDAGDVSNVFFDASALIVDREAVNVTLAQEGR